MAMPATAQNWATRDYCAVTEPKIDVRVLPSHLLTSLREEAEGIENGIGRFWRIEGPDGGVSHLWGTMHSNHPLILDLPVPVRQAIEAADVVALEIDPTHKNRASLTAQNNLTGWFRTGGTPIWQFETENTGVPAQVISQIRDRTEAMGWSRQAPDRLSFGGLASLLLSHPCDDFAAPSIPIQDSRVQMLGMISGAQILGLEPADSFLNTLNDPKNRALALSLMTVFGSYLTPEPGLRSTSFSLYLQGELGLMMALDAHLVKQRLGATGAAHLHRMDDYMLTARNAAFVKAALPHLETGSTFIAVGSFHLPGDTGLVALFREAGFTLTRVPLFGENPAP